MSCGCWSRRGIPYDEALTFVWKQDYEKLLVERVVLEAAGVKGTVLRLPAVYGPGDRQHRFWPYLKRMLDGRPYILMDPAQAGWRWTHGYVENVAAGIARAVSMPQAAARIYNLGEAQTPTVRGRVQRLGEVVGWTGEVITLPKARLPAALQTPYDWRYGLALDTTRLRRELDYREPVSARQALQRTAAWACQHPPADTSFDYAAEDAAVAAG